MFERTTISALFPMSWQPFLYIFLLVDLCRAQSCYFPDESFADGYVPCFSGSSGSPCCRNDSVCLTNGYCMGASQPYTLYRGACTDSKWSPSAGCKDVCSGVPNTRNSGCSIVLYSNVGGNVLYCPNSIVPNSSNSIGCANSQEPFQVPLGSIIPNKAVLANTSCSAEPTRATSIDTASSSTASGTGTSSASPSSCPTTSASGAQTNISDNGSVDSKTLAVGVGVGVSLGVVSLISLIWGTYERRKRQQLLNSMPSTMPMNSEPYPPLTVAKNRFSEPQELAP
ncbi:hypothetical protein V6Z92_009199 [Aspergillus fumigatus]